VQQKIDVVVAGGIEAKNLAVQGMREPSQRVPEAGVKSRERPFHGVPCQTGLNLDVF
jgi:hypothetical protein